MTTTKIAATKTKLECLECGKTFARSLLRGTVEVCCPKCGGVDVDLAKP